MQTLTWTASALKLELDAQVEGRHPGVLLPCNFSEGRAKVYENITKAHGGTLLYQGGLPHNSSHV